MLTFLRNILEVLHDMFLYVAIGFVDVVNALGEAMAVVVVAAFSVLPMMPTTAKVEPEVLEEANWFFPFATITSALVAGVTMYLIWMGVRYILRLVRAA